jgi:hypothetical protein
MIGPEGSPVLWLIAQPELPEEVSKPMSTKVPAANVKLKRAYEAPSTDDGTRILIDRLWPPAQSARHPKAQRS